MELGPVSSSVDYGVSEIINNLQPIALLVLFVSLSSLVSNNLIISPRYPSGGYCIRCIDYYALTCLSCTLHQDPVLSTNINLLPNHLGVINFTHAYFLDPYLPLCLIPLLTIRGLVRLHHPSLVLTGGFEGKLERGGQRVCIIKIPVKEGPEFIGDPTLICLKVL